MVEKKNKGGRPSLERDITAAHRLLVEESIAAANTHEEVIQILQEAGLKIKSTDAFVKHFKAEIECGTSRLHRKIGANLYAKALSDDPKNNNILIFVAKTKLGIKEARNFTIDQDKDAKKQLEQIITQVADGTLTIDEGVKTAALIEFKEKANKGSLGENFAPSVVVSPFIAEDLHQYNTEDDASTD